MHKVVALANFTTAKINVVQSVYNIVPGARAVNKFMDVINESKKIDSLEAFRMHGSMLKMAPLAHFTMALINVVPSVYDIVLSVSAVNNLQL
jgi:hypothetical protein